MKQKQRKKKAKPEKAQTNAQTGVALPPKPSKHTTLPAPAAGPASSPAPAPAPSPSVLPSPSYALTQTNKVLCVVSLRWVRQHACCLRLVCLALGGVWVAGGRGRQTHITHPPGHDLCSPKGVCAS